MTPLTIDGRLVYGLVVEVGRGLRVRLAEAEYEWLGLFEGRLVEVRLTGRPAATFHVLSASYVDPGWRWLMLAATPGRARAAG